jgi:alpha-1,2-mannosyltransferase
MTDIAHTETKPGLVHVLRDGTWLDDSRVRVYPSMLLVAYLLAAILYIVTSHDLIDPNGKPLGPDFIDIYAASQMVHSGHAAAIYDWPQHHAAEMAVFHGRAIPYYGWHYPPLFLLIVLPLAALPYGVALLAYLSVTFAGYAATLWRIVRSDRTAMLLAFAFPGVFVNAIHGQNGFLTTALLGSGLLLMDEQPWLSGIALGLLAYKPQFAGLALLLPLLTGRWRVCAGAVATIALMVFATITLFGFGVWQAFLDSLTLTRTVVLEEGSTGWERIQSVFSAVRMLGGSVALAYQVQCAVTLIVIGATVWVWRKGTSFELRAATLCLATVLATPYLLDYDLVILALPIAWLAMDGKARGFLTWEKSVLFALWILPLVSRATGSVLHIPLGAPILMLGFALAMRRAVAEVSKGIGSGLFAWGSVLGG